MCGAQSTSKCACTFDILSNMLQKCNLVLFYMNYKVLKPFKLLFCYFFICANVSLVAFKLLNIFDFKHLLKKSHSLKKTFLSIIIVQ